MSLFNFNQNGSKAAAHPEWIAQLEETQSRLHVFLDKLEQRMEELTDAAVPELVSLKVEDERAFGNMLHGVKGQLNAVRSKAQDMYEEKVDNLYYQISRQINVLDANYSLLNNFRLACSERLHNQFDTVYTQCLERLESANYTDYEKLYQQIVAEYEAIKDRFNCHQCGSIIPLQKIYFTISHLTCPSCQTKNTFSPSTLAQGLEHIGRSLAEQRTKPLLDKYYEAQQLERELYLEAHNLKLKSYSVQGKTEQEQVRTRIADLENRRAEIIKITPQLYQQYERKMFDEWKALVPDLAEQTENFYQSLQKRKH